MTHAATEEDLFGFVPSSPGLPARVSAQAGSGTEIIPLNLRDANRFIAAHHRHHGPVHGHKFSIGLLRNDALIGVAIVGRPVARAIDDGLTGEVTRLCTNGAENACSRLYSACWRAAKAMGYRRIITYILASESGTSLKASGWKLISHTRGDTWNRPNRRRADKHPVCKKRKYGIGDF